MKRLLAFFLTIPLLIASASASGPMDYTDDKEVVLSAGDPAVPTVLELDVSAPSAILMEKETGAVIFEKNADERMEPASVTKVMTVLLIVEALESGAMSLNDMVTASAYACSMGGSQIFLEEGEQMSVDEMLKSIVVASANDAAVAMAEHLCGTEAAFVNRMNERAAELGMENTAFSNCTGLLDQPEHLTTARDIAIMSRELISHDMIKDYTTIWMDTVRGGEFGLSNTNKLIYYYDGATGLKTGFTSRSMYCVSATAERDGVEYIAVILHGETSQQRFEDAKTLLSFAFANYALISPLPDSELSPVPVKLGDRSAVRPEVEGGEKLLVTKAAAQSVQKTVDLKETVTAPVSAGDELGTLTVTGGDGTVIATCRIIAAEDVARLGVLDIFFGFFRILFSGSRT